MGVDQNQLFEIIGDDRLFIDLDNLAPNDEAREVSLPRGRYDGASDMPFVKGFEKSVKKA